MRPYIRGRISHFETASKGKTARPEPIEPTEELAEGEGFEPPRGLHP